MSSLESYSDSDNNDYNASEWSGNHNSGNGNETNRKYTTSNISGPNVSITNNRNINSQSSPLALVIEKQECTSIYAMDISYIED